MTADRLGGMADCYKIKPCRADYSLVYQVRGGEVVVVVVALGKRESNFIYKQAVKRV
ncbi:hypothetical protein [Kordiimonas aestuarii]|uniref:hypothetical protein n=1 Tax=Kordiimonas aestuarii TaxID=1005925 RepID=UPI0021CF29BA|nr:hypothetical protein [Kordiimonas aestuarii]